MDTSKEPEIAAERASQEAREVDFRDLAGDDREVVIRLQDKRYRLILTKNGKLILNR